MNALEDAQADVIDPLELADVARKVLAQRPKRRALANAEAARAHWQQLAELGWLALTIPAAHDGLEQPYASIASVYRELGRVLSPAPLLNTMLCVEMLKGAAIGSDFYPGLASGEIIVAMQRPNQPPVPALFDAGVLTLEGSVEFCLAPADATHLLLSIEREGEAAIALLPMGTRGVRLVQEELWDASRALGRVELSNVTVEKPAIIQVGELAREATERAQMHFDLAIACDAIGGAEQILEDTIEYTRTRQQFGRAIGSFQAIKHRCADMRTWLEAATALTVHAAEVLNETKGPSPLPAGARLWATEVYRRISTDAIQIHGGIGFTAEQDCHLFLQRALLDEQLCGSPEDTADLLFEPLAQLAAGRVKGRA